MNMEQEKLKQHQQQQQPRVKPPELARQNQNQPPPPQKCPRCDSSNTKFCYYNNYSLSQPRYFCKNCRRYWTHGGTLRNVPVGGGCRKSKRPKPSVPSPSGGGIGTSQPLSPALPPQSLTASNSSRPLPPIMPPIGNTFYNGGSFLSSLAAMHSFPGGISQGAAVNLGGGSGPYDANMTLLQGVGLQSIKPPPSPPQYQPPLNSWTQSFINRCPAADTTTSSAATSGFWSGASADNRAGSSFDPNHWQDSNPGFNP